MEAFYDLSLYISFLDTFMYFLVMKIIYIHKILQLY
jgi:hypothetical protein